MTHRNGKIAKLPDHIREQLNARLKEGEPDSQLVEWLNTQPEVQTAVDSLFKGRPVSAQDLSEWRNSGFLDWTTLRQSLAETRLLADGVAELAATGISTQSLVLVMTAQYAALLNTWQLMPEAELERKLNALKKINAAVLKLRRSECTARKRSTARRGALTAWKPELQFQQARLELHREHFQFALEKEARRSSAAAASPASRSRARGAATDASPGSQCVQSTTSAPKPPTLDELGIPGMLSEILASSGICETSESAFSEFLASVKPHPPILSTKIAPASSWFGRQPTFAQAASSL